MGVGGGAAGGMKVKRLVPGAVIVDVIPEMFVGIPVEPDPAIGLEGMIAGFEERVIIDRSSPIEVFRRMMSAKVVSQISEMNSWG